MSKLKLTTLATQDDSASVPADTIVNGTAKAWVNFNGTGVVAIRRAFNVSTVTDNGTGNYTVNFTTAMDDTSFAALGTCEYRTTVQTDSVARTTSSVNITTALGASGSSVVAHTDKSIIAVTIFS
jgi:hypothetical protein